MALSLGPDIVLQLKPPESLGNSHAHAANHRHSFRPIKGSDLQRHESRDTREARHTRCENHRILSTKRVFAAGSDSRNLFERILDLEDKTLYLQALCRAGCGAAVSERVRGIASRGTSAFNRRDEVSIQSDQHFSAIVTIANLNRDWVKVANIGPSPSYGRPRVSFLAHSV